MKENLLIFFLIWSFQSVLGQDGYPSPTNKEDLLFYIQHSRGKNTYVYKANTGKANKFIKNKPILVYREMFDEGGEVKSLTKIQQMFAYGVKSSSLSERKYQFSLAALPDQKFTVFLDNSHRPIVETTVNGEKLAVNRIFLRLTDGTSGMNTKLDYVLFYGKNKDGNSTIEKIDM